MKNKISLLRNFSAAALMMVAIPAAFAETSSSDFTSESDKSMAAAHESFLKGDMKKASASIDKAAASVSKESGESRRKRQRGREESRRRIEKTRTEREERRGEVGR